MNKIKIAQVITRMDWGGSPDIVRIICENLDRNKYEIKFITGPTRYPSAKTKKFFEKFKDNIITVPSLKRNINPVFDLAALISLYRIFKQEKFDLVHTHTAKAGILGRIAARLSRVRRILHTSHGHNFYGYFGSVISWIIVVLERYVANFTKKIVTLTELERKDLLKFKVIEDAKISVVNTAVEWDKHKGLNDLERLRRREQFGIAQDALLIGMVGRLECIKGVEFFMNAAELLVKKLKNVKFILVGEGILRKELEERAKKVGLQGKITFTGWRDDVLEIISCLDVLVLPSLNEAVGLVLIEAQGLGVPVVATKVGGIPEVVENGKSGILVPPADSRALAEALEELILDKEKRERIAEFAKNYVKDKYSVKDLIEKISALYEGLI